MDTSKLDLIARQLDRLVADGLALHEAVATLITVTLRVERSQTALLEELRAFRKQFTEL